MRPSMMRRCRLLLPAILLPLLAVSCRDSTGPDEVTIYAIPGHLVIANEGDAPLYSVAFDEELMPLIDWVPMICDECGKVEPGTARYIDDDEVAAPGRVVIVYYWRATLRGASPELVAGPVSHRRIRLNSGLIN